jgi:hypothetical protein
VLGSSDFETAMQRRRSLYISWKTESRGSVLYNPTVVVNDNWKVVCFNEKLLIKALFSGAFIFLGRLNLKRRDLL